MMSGLRNIHRAMRSRLLMLLHLLTGQLIALLRFISGTNMRRIFRATAFKLQEICYKSRRYFPSVWNYPFVRKEAKPNKMKEWVHSSLALIGISVNDFDDAWRDGIALCALVEALCPGACPKFMSLNRSHKLNNVRLALKLVRKHFPTLQKSTMITSEQIVSGEHTDKLCRLLSQMRVCYVTNYSAPTHYSPEYLQVTAKGIGLEAGIVGKITKFYINFSPTIKPVLKIEIKGMRKEYHLETIEETDNKYKPKRLNSIPERDSDNDSELSNDDVKEDSAEKINKIQVEYHKVSDGQIEVNYIAKTSGIYSVNIMWKNQIIRGSPFSVLIVESVEKFNKASKKLFGKRHNKRPNNTPGHIQNNCRELTSSTSKSLPRDRSIDESDQVKAVLRRTSTVHRSLSKHQVISKGQAIIKRRRILRRVIAGADGSEVVLQDFKHSQSQSLASSQCESEQISMEQINTSENISLNPTFKVPIAHNNLAIRLASEIIGDALILISRHIRAQHLARKRSDFLSKCEHFHTAFKQKAGGNEMVPLKVLRKTESCDENLSPSPLAVSIINENNLFNFEKCISLRNIVDLVKRDKESKSDEPSQDQTTKSNQCLALGGKLSTNQTVDENNHTKTVKGDPALNDDGPWVKFLDKVENSYTEKGLNLTPIKTQETGEKYKVADQQKSCLNLHHMPDNKDHGNDSHKHAPFYSQMTEVPMRPTIITFDQSKSAFNSISPTSMKYERPIYVKDESTQVQYEEIKMETGWDSSLRRFPRRRVIKLNDSLDVPTSYNTGNQRYNSSKVRQSDLKYYPDSTKYNPTAKIVTLKPLNSSLKRSCLKSPARMKQVDLVLKLLNRWKPNKNPSQSVTLHNAKLKFGRSSVKMNSKQRRVRFSGKFKIYRRTSSKSTSKEKSHSKEGNSSLSKDQLPLNENKINDTTNPYMETNDKILRDIMSPSRTSRQLLTTQSRASLYSLSSMKVQGGSTSSLTSEETRFADVNTIPEETQQEPSCEDVSNFGVAQINRDGLLSELSKFRRLSLPAFRAPSIGKIDSTWHFKTLASSNSDSLWREISHGTPNETPVTIRRRAQSGSAFTFADEEINHYVRDRHEQQNQNDSTTEDPFPPALQNVIENEDNFDEEEVNANQLRRSINRDSNGYFSVDEGNESDITQNEQDVLAQRCYAFGSGLHYGQVNIKNNFQVRTKDAGNGSVAVSITGPRLHTVTETSVTYTGDDLYEVIYEVTQPGIYVINVKWCDVSIMDSPFMCKVTF